MPANPIEAFLAASSPLVLDGALADELERRGADLRDPLWSAKLLIERPDLIRTVHLDYFRAGADLATTATYQATFEGFARRGVERRAAAQLMQSAVALAASAREEFWNDPVNRAGRRRPLIAASIGPYGAMLADGSEYRGHYGLTEAALREFHRPRLAVLAAAGADLLACETLPCLGEALALARTLEEFPGVFAWISFACRDGSSTWEGEEIGDCVARLNAFSQVAAVGVNCTAPQFIASLIARMRARTDKPLVVYPNSGERFDPRTKSWSASSCSGTAFAGLPATGGGVADPDSLTSRVRDWHQAGARLIGGCCRTGPEHVAAVRAACR
jgi:homocysteine S-methyltransferase